MDERAAGSEVMQLTSASEGDVVRTNARVREPLRAAQRARGWSATETPTAGQGAPIELCERARGSPSSRPPPSSPTVPR